MMKCIECNKKVAVTSGMLLDYDNTCPTFCRDCEKKYYEKIAGTNNKVRFPWELKLGRAGKK